MLLPVVLMLAKAIADVVDENGNGPVKRALDFIGTPLIALLLAVLLALYTLGRGIRLRQGAAVSARGPRCRRSPASC